MAPPDPASEPVASSQHPAAAAYAKLLPEILAVPDDELITINIDVPTAITTVLGSLPESARYARSSTTSCAASISSASTGSRNTR